MTIEVANTGTTNTFQFLINRVNELATAMSSNAVTTESNTATGNAAITGTFTSNVLNTNTVITNTVRVSNSTANVVISIPNTTLIANGNYYLNANGSWGLINPAITSLSVNTTGTSTQSIDSYSMSVLGGAEYFIRVKDNNANGYHALKVLTFHDGINAFSTEYGTMVSNTTLGTFEVSTNTTHVILNMSPVSSNTSVNISRVNF